MTVKPFLTVKNLVFVHLIFLELMEIKENTDFLFNVFSYYCTLMIHSATFKKKILLEKVSNALKTVSTSIVTILREQESL